MKNFKGFLLPSNDPLNFQYRRRLGKDSKSSGNRQKPGHPASSCRSLTSPGFQPDLPWSSTTSCCWRAQTLTPGEQSRVKSWSPWKVASQSTGTWSCRGEGSEGSEELPQVEQEPLPRPGSRWGGLALAPATTQALQLGLGLGALPFPFWLCRAGASSTKLLLGRFKIPHASQIRLDLQPVSELRPNSVSRSGSLG